MKDILVHETKSSQTEVEMVKKGILDHMAQCVIVYI